MQMQKEMSGASTMMFWLIVAIAAIALIWAWFMPVEISVAALGQIYYLGEPQAVDAGPGGVTYSPLAKSFAHVERDAALIQIAPEDGEPFTVGAPDEGALIWQRSLIKGDRVQEGERIAVVYPDDPLGLLIRLSDQDIRKVELGMDVRVKLDAFPMQDYGVLYGKIVDITPELGANGLIDTQVLVSLEGVSSNIALRPGLIASADVIIGRTTLLRRILR